MPDHQTEMSKSEIAALQSRWDPAAQKEMLEMLKQKCRAASPDRPASIDLRGISLVHQELSNLDLSGCDLSHATLTRCNLTGSNLSYSTCRHTGFEQSVLDECEFIGSNLRDCTLNECSAKHSGFGGADLSGAGMIHSDFTEATLSRSKLVRADLRAAILKNARMSEADLSHATFNRANLEGADLKNSDVNHTNFELADMQGARLLGIQNFKTARWLGTDIRGMDLRGAYLVRRYIADENYLYEFQTRSRFHRALYLIWWASSDCGRSLLRWFVWLLAATLLFALIYTQVEIDYGDHETVFSPVYFSFVTLTTLGYGDAVPASLMAQIFVTLQAVFGYMGLGGLLSILGNKMARRAE